MSIHKYTLHGENYVFYAKTLFRVGDPVDQPDMDTCYYVKINDMEKTDGIISDEMVVRLGTDDALAETARYVSPPNSDHYCGIIDLDATECVREATQVEETQEFEDHDTQWSWQSRVNQMCRNPADLLTPPLLVGVEEDSGHEQLREWVDGTPAEIHDTVGRTTAIVVCPETMVRDLCEADFVTSVEVEGVAHAV